MSFETWLLFCATEVVLCLSPGPAVLLVVAQSLTRGLRAGSSVGIGILLANALYFAISATGIAALLVASGELFFAIKWVGAAYLMWLGAKALIWAGRRPEEASLSDNELEDATLGVLKPDAKGVTHGFITQAANPKSLIFFGALLPQFIEPGAAVAPQIAILGISSITIELAVLVGYAILANRGRRLAAPSLTVALERIGGGLLIAAGAGLASLRGDDG